METIGRYPLVSFPVLGFRCTQMDLEAILGTWICMAAVTILCWWGTRDLEAVPGRLQYFLEVVVEAFDSLCRDSLGRKARKFLPMVGSTFLLILACNWIGVLPGFIEPTKDINTCLALGMVGFLVTLREAIADKGVGGYIGEFFQPIAFMAPLNLIGEVAKVISISCRLFGNIMGGAIIITVVSYLTCYFLMPVGLMAYFGLVAGLIQAFVFTMLTLTYLAVAVG